MISCKIQESKKKARRSTNRMKRIGKSDAVFSSLQKLKVKETKEKPLDTVKIHSLLDFSCWASQGKIDGPSLISVGLGCSFRNVISHLIGHVVGLWHPQNRMDRNDYLRIFWQNINAGNFLSLIIH